MMSIGDWMGSMVSIGVWSSNNVLSNNWSGVVSIDWCSMSVDWGSMSVDCWLVSNDGLGGNDWSVDDWSDDFVGNSVDSWS